MGSERSVGERETSHTGLFNCFLPDCPKSVNLITVSAVVKQVQVLKAGCAYCLAAAIYSNSVDSAKC